MGPPESAMWSLGDTIASSIVAQTARVPTLPWSGSGLQLSMSGSDLNGSKTLTLPSDLYRRGCTVDAEEVLKAAQKIGFPVMIKALEGDGGKGIHKADSATDFSTLFRPVQQEVDEDRRVRHRHLPVRSRLFRSAPPPEDHRRGSRRHCQSRSL